MSRTAGMVVLLHNYARLVAISCRLTRMEKRSDHNVLVRKTNRAKSSRCCVRKMRAQRERLRRGFYTGLTVLEDSLRKFCTKTELTASWRSSLARKLSIGNCVGVPTASSGPFGPAIFGCARL